MTFKSHSRSSEVSRFDRAHIRFPIQVNNVLCYFKELNCATKIKLFMSYCSSIFRSELWSLDVSDIEVFCVEWRKGLRRVMSLPPATHRYLLPAV